MPALSGQVIMTISDSQGQPAVIISWFFDPSTRVLRNNPAPWTSADGTVWPINSGALIAVNQLGRAVKVRVNDDQGVLIRQVRLPAGGATITKNQLANAAPPDGPYISADDLNGLTFDLA